MRKFCEGRMRHLLHVFAVTVMIVGASSSTAQVKVRPETKPESSTKELQKPGAGTEPSKPPPSSGVKEMPEGVRRPRAPIPSTPQKVTPLYEIKKTISAQASQRGVVLTEEAKDSLTKAVAQEERYLVEKGGSATLATKTADETVEQLRAMKVTGEVDKRQVEAAIVKMKIERVRRTVDSDISREAAAAGSVPSNKAREFLKMTIERRTEIMARNGQSDGEIDESNSKYQSLFFKTAGSGPLDEKRVVEINKGLFRKIISLKIDSEPDGALVELIGLGNVGKTKIDRRPLESEKEYTFVVRKQGYKMSTRKYIPLPFPEEQELREILIEESK